MADLYTLIKDEDDMKLIAGVLFDKGVKLWGSEDRDEAIRAALVVYEGNGDAIIFYLSDRNSVIISDNSTLDRKEYLGKDVLNDNDFFRVGKKKKILKNVGIATGVVLMPGGLIFGAGYLLYKKIRG